MKRGSRPRKRLSESAIEELTRRRRGEPPSEKSTGKVAISRSRLTLPSREDVVRLAAQEASALEWVTQRKEDVHESAVRAHIEEMGPYRAEELVQELGRVNWDARKPGRPAFAPGSQKRGWAIFIIRTLERLHEGRKTEWIPMSTIARKLKWTPSVRGRMFRRLEREGVVEISPDGKQVKLMSLESRIEAMLVSEPESRRKELAEFIRNVEEGRIVFKDLRLP
jgi:hypothetical protein